jgi:hypothetical protein
MRGACRLLSFNFPSLTFFAVKSPGILRTANHGKSPHAPVSDIRAGIFNHGWTQIDTDFSHKGRDGRFGVAN